MGEKETKEIRIQIDAGIRKEAKDRGLDLRKVIETALRAEFRKNPGYVRSPK